MYHGSNRRRKRERYRRNIWNNNENVPKLMSDTKSQFPEAQRTHARFNTRTLHTGISFSNYPPKKFKNKKNSERSQRGENILPIKEQR